ncbi:lysophospholipid acyltransferase family protein [Dermabacter sp. Marseille-Q3180]|uniref:lysophospholipid acyltransferase family protein n=1 Tax=Dermabacter sp. Marseille-Q3180 TaxID=2758090 RepID=UPI0020259066|nr:lysophospholipid acyltransferase family protein [Dermabacter sp. Marseille-Q3180]
MFYETAHTFVAPMIKAWWRPKVTGLENVPKTGPVIIAANHRANVDSFLVPVVFHRKVRYIIKADFWHKTGLTASIKQRFFEAVGSIPVERGTLKSAHGSLEKARQVLQEGGLFAIYPEGTRSKTGKLGRGRTGIAWLEEKTGAPIIPVGLVGTEKLFVPGKTLPRPRRAKLEVRIGTPIDFSHIDRSLPENRRRRAITDRVMEEIQKLSGQERETSQPKTEH